MRKIFRPESLALIGASSRDGSIGKQIFQNIKESSYKGKVYPVSINHKYILGEHAFKTVDQLPEIPDLAVIAVPDREVLKVVRECGKTGIKRAVIISDGFGEKGSIEGISLQQKLIAIAKKYSVSILGPSSIGVISPYVGLNASISSISPKKGNVAFISQSGAMCNAILDWGDREHVGFSYFASIGVMADINWGDILLFLGDDPHTKAILLYMEAIGDARSFLSAVREIAYTKPVIVVKPGKTNESAKVALYHSGNLSGNHEVFQAAFRRGGVLQVESLADLFYMSSVLGKQPVPKSNRLAIITNAGGPAVLATDALIDGGGALADLMPETVEQLKKVPKSERWWINNPLYIHLSASEEAFANALQIVINDKTNDGILVIITPQMSINLEKLAEKLVPFSHVKQKPLIIGMMGGLGTGKSRVIFTKAGIPVFSFPDVAARVFNYMWQYGYNIRGIYETPRLPRLLQSEKQRVSLVNKELNQFQRAKTTKLSVIDSMELLAKYSLPTAPLFRAITAEEATLLAKQIGFPVVMKIHSELVTKKYHWGGVILNLQSKKAVKKFFQILKEKLILQFGIDAFKGVIVQKMYPIANGLELRLASRYDEQFGPVLELANAGRIVDIYRDKVLALPPLNTTLAQRMLEQTKIYQALKKYGKVKGTILEEFEQVLVSFSQLAAEHPLIKKIEINPLLINENTIKILDTTIDLHPSDVVLKELTPLAIRPYPVEYESNWHLKDGTEVVIRPVRPDDEPLFLHFHKTLSDESVYLRYFHSMSYGSRVAHERLSRICFIDYDREIALLVIKNETANPVVLGIGRIVKLRVGNIAEFSITISDNAQGQGIGTELMQQLINISKREGVKELIADILPNNAGMRAICKKFNFKSIYDIEDQVVKVSLELK
ncbi:MAG: bifunctional acetate--CoA ligase family protein/GNAT family N-acetyltransferase [Bacteroidota bacterium]